MSTDLVFRGSYSPPAGGAVDLVFGAVPSIGVRALLLAAGFLRQITDAEFGTMVAVVVIDVAVVKQRSAAEGTPLVMDTSLGSIRCVAGTESLLA